MQLDGLVLRRIAFCDNMKTKDIRGDFCCHLSLLPVYLCGPQKARCQEADQSQHKFPKTCGKFPVLSYYICEHIFSSFLGW